MISDQELKALLDTTVAALTGHDRDTALGYQGEVRDYRLAVNLEAVCVDGAIRPLDLEHFAKTGTIAWRDWVTLRGGKMGGRQDVKPGGVGGISVPTLFQVLGMATGIPLIGAIGGAASSTVPNIATEDAIASLLRGVLLGKVQRYGSSS